MKGFVQRYSLLVYFALAFAFSWTYEAMGMYVLHALHLPSDYGEIVLVPVAFGPAISAMLLLVLTEGKTGLANMLRRFLLWRVPLRWYLLVFVVLPLFVLFSFFALPGALASFQVPTPDFLLRYFLSYVLILLLGGPLGEEPGWRGFALPRLQQRYGPLVSSLVLGLFWGLWHLPSFILIPGYNGAGNGFVGIASAFIPFVAAITASAVIYTWVFNNTKGSLFLMVLFHASFNTAGTMFATLFPSAISGSLMANVIEEGLFVVAALILILVTRGQLR